MVYFKQLVLFLFLEKNNKRNSTAVFILGNFSFLYLKAHVKFICLQGKFCV